MNCPLLKVIRDYVIYDGWGGIKVMLIGFIMAKRLLKLLVSQNHQNIAEVECPIIGMKKWRWLVRWKNNSMMIRKDFQKLLENAKKLLYNGYTFFTKMSDSIKLCNLKANDLLFDRAMIY